MINFLKSNKTLADYGAKLRRREVSPAAMAVQSAWPLNAGSPFISARYKNYWKQIILQVEFKGSWSEIEGNKSAFAHEMANGKLQFHDELDKAYTYVLDGNPSTSDHIDSQYESLTYHLLAYKEDAHESHHTLTAGETIEINCLTHLPLWTVLEVSGSGTISVTVNGRQITANSVTGTRSIGDGKVMESGESRWQDTSLPGGEFLELQPGRNQVSVSGGDLLVRTKRRYL